MSDSNRISTYQNAYREYLAAETQAKRLADIVVAAGKKLEYWPTVTLSNTGVSLPTNQYGRDIDASIWPTALEIAEALSVYHAAQIAMREAWDLIKEPDRIGLQPPPGMSR